MQGLGNVGYHAAKFCREAGAIVIAIAEREGGIRNDQGLNEEEVRRHRAATGSILQFPGATDVAVSADVLRLESDVLIPAALENQVTEVNASDIRAKIVFEGANGPTTPGAEQILRDRGVLVVPDIYANAGGVTVSYFEWLKNLSHVQFGRLARRLRAATAGRFAQVLEQRASDRDALMDNVDELAIVNSGLEDTMVRAYQEIRETKRRHPGIKHLRTAALVNAIDKIARACVERGIFP